MKRGGEGGWGEVSKGLERGREEESLPSERLPKK